MIWMWPFCVVYCGRTRVFLRLCDTVDELWNVCPTIFRRGLVRLSIITANHFTTYRCQSLVSARWRLLQMFWIMRTPSSLLLLLLLLYAHLHPTLQNTHTPTLSTLPSYTHHHLRQETGGEAYKRVRDFGGRREETTCDPVPSSPLHFLHRPPLDLWPVWAAQTFAPSSSDSPPGPCDSCSGWSPALLPQHAAPGDVSSSHGGCVQCSSSGSAPCGRQEPHACEQGKKIPIVH